MRSITTTIQVVAPIVIEDLGLLQVLVLDLFEDNEVDVSVRDPKAR